MTTTNLVTVEIDRGIATLTMNRPDKLNALNRALIAELDETLRRLAADESVRGLILTGAGEKAFVAGADIAELSQMGSLDGIEVSRQGQRAFRFLERMPKPSIAAINGFALGGGLELALACHLRTAASTARLGLPEVKLGIIPGYGGTVRLPRLVGRGRALELIFTGDMIDATEAHRIGLVNRVFEPDTLLDQTRTLLAKIIANGPVALAMAIESVDHAAGTHIDDALRLESDLFGLLAGTQDMTEGMQAFLEKRTPAFRGR
jgi:enoyl-CoA hydratase